VRRQIGVVLAVLAAVVLAGCDWNQFLYGSGRAGLNNIEFAISTSNVSTLTERFTAPTGGLLSTAAPVIAGGVAYVDSGDGNLYAFSASGTTSCSGAPATCTPLWTASVGGATSLISSPAIASGVIYVVGGDGVVRAFDAGGKTDCGGTPTVCLPLWTANVSADSSVAPLVVGGTLFVNTNTGVVALDAAGQNGCSGAPTVCAPLWVTNFAGFTSGTTGTLYVAGTSVIEAFDVSGTTNCTGSAPKTCSPLVEYQPNYPLTSIVPDYAVVSGSTLYVQANNFTAPPVPNHEDVEAFDAAGATNCAPQGTLKVCTPLWTTTDVPNEFPPAPVGNGSLYVSGSGGVSVFDASGTVNCSGSPKVCAPMWTSTAAEAIDAPMSVANGVLYGTDNNSLFALDASGHKNCTGSVCSPLWSATPPTSGNLFYSGPVVANGLVYATVGDDLVAYALPG
jgi:hypothetical protein